MIRFQVIDYNAAHRTAEVIFRGLMVRMRCRLSSNLRESKRICPI